MLLYLPLYVSVFKKVDSGLYSIKITEISEALFELCFLAVACIPYLVSFIMKLLGMLKNMKDYKKVLDRMSNLLQREWSLTLSIVVIGFLPNALRLAKDYEGLVAGLTIIPVAYLACLVYTLYNFYKFMGSFG